MILAYSRLHASIGGHQNNSSQGDTCLFRPPQTARQGIAKSFIVHGRKWRAPRHSFETIEGALNMPNAKWFPIAATRGLQGRLLLRERNGRCRTGGVAHVAFSASASDTRALKAEPVWVTMIAASYMYPGHGIITTVRLPALDDFFGLPCMPGWAQDCCMPVHAHARLWARRLALLPLLRQSRRLLARTTPAWLSTRRRHNRPCSDLESVQHPWLGT